ncbi:MAG: cytochrome c biogenesis protein CcsA [Methylotetracoccus sp.]
MSIDSWLFSVAALVAYGGATVAMVRSLQRDYLSDRGSRAAVRPALWLGGVAVILQALGILADLDNSGFISPGFLRVSAFATLLVAAVLLLTALVRPIEKLGILVFPLCALTLALQLGFSGDAPAPKLYSWPMKLHIVASMLAYAFLNIAAVQAILLALQEWRLRSHHMSRLSRSLPPLQTMESLLFQLIAAGFALLSVSLVTGFVFLENLFAQHLAHKTVLSLIAWLVFGVLLWGRIIHGWRGQTAIRWTLGGFIALMLGYFGSKMVLELILHRV